MNITKIVCSLSEVLEKELSLPFRIDNDVIGSTGEGMCCRVAPSPFRTREYSGGTREITYSLDYYIRSQNAELARNTLDALVKFTADLSVAFDANGNSYVGEEEIMCAMNSAIDFEDGYIVESVTLPQFLEKDEKGFTSYTASVRVSTESTK